MHRMRKIGYLNSINSLFHPSDSSHTTDLSQPGANIRKAILLVLFQLINPNFKVDLLWEKKSIVVGVPRSPQDTIFTTQPTRPF